MISGDGAPCISRLVPTSDQVSRLDDQPNRRSPEIVLHTQGTEGGTETMKAVIPFCRLDQHLDTSA
jgi:hypothetical protein